MPALRRYVDEKGEAVSHPFDFAPCMHKNLCPSWWNCERRGCYADAKERTPDHRDGYRRGFGEGSHGQSSVDGRRIGSEYPKKKDEL